MGGMIAFVSLSLHVLLTILIEHGVCCSLAHDADSITSKVPQPRIQFSPRCYVCYRALEPIKVDGSLRDASWVDAGWTDDFVDIEGDLRPKPRFRTRAKMLWDDEYFYIAAELEEPHVWATLKRRDSIIFYDNDFEVFIDPTGDTHNYYEIEINAFGTVWDLLLVKPYRDGGPAIHSWDIQGLKSGVRVNGAINDPQDEDVGWTVEVAIPWTVLKECAPEWQLPQSGDQWRVNFSRVEWRVVVDEGRYVKVKDPATGKPLPEDNWVWSPQGVVNMHYPEMWGYVQFSGKSVGSGRDRFEVRDDEKVKWALRRIYYAQWAYKAEHDCFADEIEKLDLDDVVVEGYAVPPVLQTTQSQFEAIYKSEGGKDWHINQNGLVWKD